MMKKIALIVLLVVLPLLSWGQGKVYTKKARMEDFENHTTKVVVSGESLLAITLREEIMSRWRISPFEFCTPEEYNTLKTNNNLFFINLIVDNDVAFLSLTRGGKDDSDMLHRPFEIVRIPFAADGASTGQEFSFLGAIIDVMQHFTEDAMSSDIIGYANLSNYSQSNIKGKTVYLSPGDADKAMTEGTPNAVCGLIITPVTLSKKCFTYRMLISADTHELYYFEQERYKSPEDRYFSEVEAKSFEKRNGVVVR